MSKGEVEVLIVGLIQGAHEQDDFQKIGKNIYITNHEQGIRITINQNTTRVITVDRVYK